MMQLDAPALVVGILGEQRLAYRDAQGFLSAHILAYLAS